MSNLKLLKLLEENAYNTSGYKPRQGLSENDAAAQEIIPRINNWDDTELRHVSTAQETITRVKKQQVPTTQSDMENTQS